MTDQKDLVTLTIDGREVTAEKGTLIIRAAEQVGIRIPRFCDHPLLKPVAACRQCLVEVAMPDRSGNVRMMPKPQPSCAMEIVPGMEVHTQYTSDVALTAQEGVMEFLLINHPLDCPICDKGGECPLQNQAMTEGRDSSRFYSAKRVFPKPMRLTSQILLDRDRCILCQRCVRFAREIPGDPFIALQGRGGGASPTDDHNFMGEQVGSFDAEVLGFHMLDVDGPERTDISGPYGREGIISSVYSGPERQSDRDQLGRTFASYFSGNIIQICPVGALTSNTYRFKARPFDLVSTPTVAEHDASGSAVRADVRRGEVKRRLSGNDPEVNEEWITDKDRFGFPWYKQQDRLKYPLVRNAAGDLVTASWSEALDIAAKGIAKAAETGEIGFLPGGRQAFEDAWAWSKFARVVGKTNNIDERWRRQSAEEEQFLGALVAGRGLGVTYEDVQKAGNVLLVALEPEDEIGSLFLRLRKGLAASTVAVTTVAPFYSRGSEKLDAKWIPVVPGEEVAVVQQIAEGGTHEDTARALDGGVILVGERAAQTPGLLTEVVRLADRTGARLQWVPRRSGDRGSIDAGLLPRVLPFGRTVADEEARESMDWGELPTAEGMSAAQMVEEASKGLMNALVVGGLDLRDWVDPDKAKKALEETPFVVALEVRQTPVTDLADVVFPVAPPAEKNGTFINWEGRLRPFGQSIASFVMPDREVLSMIAYESGVDLKVETLAHLYEEVNPLMIWRGARLPLPSGITGGDAPVWDAVAGGVLDGDGAGAKSSGKFRLASHKVMVDLGRMLDGADDLRGSARVPVAFVSKASLDALGATEDQTVEISGGRGSVTVPIESGEVPDGVVWLPECSFGEGLLADLGLAGREVTITPVREEAK